MSSLLTIGLEAMNAAHMRAASAAETVARAPVGGEDMAAAIIELSKAKTAAKAGAAITRTGEEMTGRLLDILS